MLLASCEFGGAKAWRQRLAGAFSPGGVGYRQFGFRLFARLDSLLLLRGYPGALKILRPAIQKLGADSLLPGLLKPHRFEIPQHRLMRIAFGASGFGVASHVGAGMEGVHIARGFLLNWHALFFRQVGADPVGLAVEPEGAPFLVKAEAFGGLLPRKRGGFLPVQVAQI